MKLVGIPSDQPMGAVLVAGYVDMSTVDEATSKSIGKAVTEAGGRFLEVGTQDLGGA
jgi:3-hydroxyisobutyrate dehydrogenase-like beta-hydroxyacid dehydrogenase